VTYSADGGNSGGFSWHTSKRAAEAAAAEAVKNDPKEYEEHRSGPPDIDVIEIKPTKADILIALQSFASHPDNG
jgi:hypothetical protein